MLGLYCYLLCLVPADVKRMMRKRNVAKHFEGHSDVGQNVVDSVFVLAKHSQFFTGGAEDDLVNAIPLCESDFLKEEWALEGADAVELNEAVRSTNGENI